MGKLKKPYRCENCKKLFSYDDRKIVTRKMYGITTTENACPFCNSWNVSAYCFGKDVENKYLNYDVLRDKRYYTKR